MGMKKILITIISLTLLFNNIYARRSRRRIKRKPLFTKLQIVKFDLNAKEIPEKLIELFNNKINLYFISGIYFEVFDKNSLADKLTKYKIDDFKMSSKKEIQRVLKRLKKNIGVSFTAVKVGASISLNVIVVNKYDKKIAFEDNIVSKDKADLNKKLPLFINRLKNSLIRRSFNVDQKMIDKYNLVYINPVTYLMGNNKLTTDYEKYTEHKVSIKPFYISMYEVKNKLYFKYIKDKKIKLPEDPKFKDYKNYFEKYIDYPVLNITYSNAINFTKWLSKQTEYTFRLPTEAEWEYSARGSDKNNNLYTWVGEINYDLINCNKKYGGPREISSFKANVLGLFNMVGNIREFCLDYYDPTFYTYSKQDNPVNLVNTGYVVTRGGSWFSTPGNSTVFYRGLMKINAKDVYTGFRVVLELKTDNNS